MSIGFHPKPEPCLSMCSIARYCVLNLLYLRKANEIVNSILWTKNQYVMKHQNKPEMINSKAYLDEMCGYALKLLPGSFTFNIFSKWCGNPALNWPSAFHPPSTTLSTRHSTNALFSTVVHCLFRPPFLFLIGTCASFPSVLISVLISDLGKGWFTVWETITKF